MIRAIVKKELRHYFFSPLAYVVISIFLAITGWFFSSNLFLIKEAELRGMMEIMPLVLMFFIPAVTMRTIAEEKKLDTIQLILTMPLKEWQLVVGKYLSVLILFLVTLLFSLFYPLVLSLIGNPDSGVIISSYLGIILLGSSYIAIGIFASSLTSNQVIAFISGFSIIFSVFMISRLQMILPVGLQGLVEKFSILSHFDNLARGVISTSDMVFFILLNILFLSASTLLLVTRRGR